MEKNNSNFYLLSNHYWVVTRPFNFLVVGGLKLQFVDGFVRERQFWNSLLLNNVLLTLAFFNIIFGLLGLALEMFS